MCFSAQASFTAGTLLSLAGLYNLSQVQNRGKKSMNATQRAALTAFAAVPLLFGLHQLSEGWVWLEPTNLLAIRLFAYTAWTFWPLYISSTCCWMEFQRPASLPQEPQPWARWTRARFSVPFRQRQLCVNVFLAVLCYLVFTYCLWAVEPLSVNTDHGRMEYKTCQKYTEAVPEWQNKLGRAVYTYSVVASLFFSSLPYAWILASITGVSAAVSYYLWEGQFESTWCYFAAFISSFILVMVRCELAAYPDGSKTKKKV